MSAKSGGNDRIPQPIDDIGSADELLRFATAGQLEQVLRERPSISQAQIALGAGLGTTRPNAAATLSGALRNRLTNGQLQKLDEIIGALAPDLDGTGGLCSLALRLSTEGRHAVRSSGLSAHVPSSWTRKILKDPPGGEVGVLIQASALISAFRAVDQMDTGGRGAGIVRADHREEMDRLINRLILIAVGPPTSRNYDAQIMLGVLASYAFDDQMRKQLDYHLRRSPLGFRVWRAITKLVILNADSPHTEALSTWVRGLIHDSEGLRTSSLYPGRGLDLELAITVPAKWSPPGDDWVGDALFCRAMNPEATIRERGTAVHGLWQRAITEKRADLEETEAKLRELIAQFRDPAARPDAPAGMRWIAATLEQAIDQRVPVCNHWPEVEDPWFQNIKAAAAEVDYGMPRHLQAGAKNLFKHMLLQNAGVYRRKAIETVVTSCWTEPVAAALRHLLEHESGESWLRIRALFALSFLQAPNVVEADLVRGCEQAFDSLQLGENQAEVPPRTRITEMHAALFAIGDCLGVTGAEDQARSARDSLRSILTFLADAPKVRADILHRAARAAAYLLTFTAQPREDGQPDLSEELLGKLSHQADPVTASLSRWALRFRFKSDGTIRPLLDEADKDESNGSHGAPRG
jgi:hypothetical protein